MNTKPQVPEVLQQCAQLQSYMQPQLCDGIDLFFSSKPNTNISHLFALFATYNVAVILDKDTGDLSLSDAQLAKGVKVTCAKIGKEWRMTCRWSKAASIIPLEVIERNRNAWGRNDLGYTGCELYLEMPVGVRYNPA